jgi:sterol desaturase/sphingolipid hydroxylase (fatty acid hydroxylase superfamily)
VLDLVHRLQPVVFVTSFVLSALLERTPWRARGPRRVGRNAAMLVVFLALNTLLGAAGALVLGQGWGLLPRLGLPLSAEVAIGVVVVDVTAFAVHVAAHRLPWWWRMHRVHHSDVSLDVTSTYRFHPGEVALSFAVRTAVLAALGVPLLAPALYVLYMCFAEHVLHARTRVPLTLERAAALVVCTPRMHALHHDRGVDANFGLGLSVWDRLFGTFRAPAGERASHPGVAGLEDERHQTVVGMLALPFRVAEMPRER